MIVCSVFKDLCRHAGISIEDLGGYACAGMSKI